MTTYSPSSRSSQESAASLVPAVVNPAPRSQEEVLDAQPRAARPASPSEQIASFLEALAGVMRSGIQPGEQRVPAGRGQQPPSHTPGIGVMPGAPGSDHDGAGAPEDVGPVLAYHLVEALRNLNPLVIITRGPRGPLCIIHLPRKAYVIILVAFFLMFASINRIPDIWEIMFGIIGIY